MLQGMTRSLSCLLVDDSRPILDALRRLLVDEGYEVAAVAETGEQALERLAGKPVDVVVLDFRLPGISGLEVARRAAAISTSSIVFYTSYADEPFVWDAFDAGAHAVVLKDAPPANLLEALAAVATGETYLDPQLVSLRKQGAG
ncbi:MAG: hypothetical protein QOJ43_1630 [Gaiellaceae bacterium]|nr:hypothetical protein [Gaiellaceae bacterium]